MHASISVRSSDPTVFMIFADVVSKFRPIVPVVVVTSSPIVAYRCSMVFGQVRVGVSCEAASIASM